jgi:hypothetical protein
MKDHLTPYRTQLTTQEENRETIRLLSRQIIEQIDPGEMPETLMVMEPLIDKAGAGEVVPVGKGSAFGFGELDLLAQIVIPTVVGILSNMLYNAGVQRIKDLKQKRDAIAEAITVVASAEVEDKVKRTGKRFNRKQKQGLINITITVVKVYINEIDRDEGEQSIDPSEPPAQSEVGKLRDKIVKTFSDDDVRMLCQDLGIEYAELSGQTLTVRAGELVSYCDRRGRLDDLKGFCRHRRPHISW